MKIVANLEISIQIVEKNGLHYTQVWDVETMNLIFEEESLTKQGACCKAADFVMERLSETLPTNV